MAHPLTPPRRRHGLLAPLALTLAASIALVAWPHLAEALAIDPAIGLGRWGRTAVSTAAVLAGAWLLVRLLDVVLWRGVVERRAGSPVPRLLVDVCAAIVWLGAAIVIAAWALQVEVFGLVATSGVTIAVIGFALRDIIASLFAGMALSMEKPFAIGDWIEVEAGTVAQVEQVGWLTTRAVTKDGVGLVVPNARLATTVWRNYTHPRPEWRDSVKVTLDYAVPGDVAERLLIAALNEVRPAGRMPQRPDVKIAEFNERGVVWVARYWLNDYGVAQDVRFLVQKAVLRHLHYAGIEPARGAHVEPVAQIARTGPADPHEHLAVLLAEHELFGTLDEPQRQGLMQGAQRRFCRAELPIVCAGEPGSSMFVVVEGILRVAIPDPDGREVRADDMTPGSIFGEFSLLTGEPRSATVVPFVDSVVYEIGKADLQPILEQSPGLAQELSRILAARQARTRDLLTRRSPDDTAQAKPSQHAILDRLRAFFGLPEA
jgi:small-conductance mechanosensitive channel/CRP-like cAMP-binding protein